MSDAKARADAAASMAKHQINEVSSKVSYEQNVHKLNDPNSTIGETIGAYVDATKDKANEMAEAAAAEYQKQRATH